MNVIQSRLSFFLAMLVAGAMSDVAAQNVEPAHEVVSVNVTGVRDPAMMAYKDAYDFLTRIDKVSGNRLDAVIRLVRAKTKKPVRGLEVSLRGEQTSEKVPVSEEGIVTVPLSERALADKAEFVTNQKNGTIEVNLRLVPRLPAEHLTYGDVQASLDAAERVRKELVPWYLRLFAGSVHTVAICYPDNTRTVEVSNSATPVRPAIVEHWDTVRDRQLFCVDFKAGDRSLAADSVISAAPGWHAIYQ